MNIVKNKIDDNKILELRQQGKTYKEIADILGCSKTTIRNHIENINNQTNIITNNNKNTNYNKKKGIPLQEIIKLHEEGKTDSEIAIICGCTRPNITKRLNKVGYNQRKSKIDNIPLRNKISESLKGKMVGERNPNYKGYKDEIEIARGLFKTISKEIIRNSNYKCQICGKKSREYHVHHIKPFSLIVRTFIETTYSGNIKTFAKEIMNYPDFIDKNNLIMICPECHREIHYTDNPELSPYRWESATTIKSINEEPVLIEKQVEQN